MSNYAIIVKCGKCERGSLSSFGNPMMDNKIRGIREDLL